MYCGHATKNRRDLWRFGDVRAMGGLGKKNLAWRWERWHGRKCLVRRGVECVFLLVKRGRWMVFCGEVVVFCVVIFAV